MEVPRWQTPWDTSFRTGPYRSSKAEPAQVHGLPPRPTAPLNLGSLILELPVQESPVLAGVGGGLRHGILAQKVLPVPTSRW